MEMSPTENKTVMPNGTDHSENINSVNSNDENQQEDNQSIRKLSKKDYIHISILCLNTICHGISLALLSSFFPISARKKGLTLGDVGIIFAAFPVMTIIVSLVLSKYVNKIGTKRILLASLLIMAISVLPFAFVMKLPKTSFYGVCLISRAGQGVALVGGQIAAFAVAANEYKDRLSTIIGLLEMSISVGIAIGPAIGGVLYDSLGFSAPFYVQMGICILLFVITYIFVKPPSNIIDEKDEKINLNSSKIPMKFKTFITVPILMVPMASATMGFISFAYLDVTLTSFMDKVFGLSATYIGLITLSIVGVYSIFAPLVGRFCDKKGHHGVFMMLGFFIVALSLVFVGPAPIFNLGHHLWSSITCLVIMFIGFVFMNVPALGLCFKLGGLYNIDDSDSAQSFITTTFIFSTNIGNLIGPLVGGFLMDKFGFDLTSGFMGLAVLLVGIFMCASLYVVFRKHEKRKDIHSVS